MMKKISPAIILIEPQMGENIGWAARAMLNFGLTDLRIVSPRDGWPNEAATANAAGAFDIITPHVFENFEDAVADLEFLYATTARTRDMVKPVFDPKEAMEKTFASDAATGFVFGRERTGLENHHVALCHAIIHVPTNPDFFSLNLAQAVLLIGYEYILHKGTKVSARHEPAPHGQMLELIKRLEGELDAGGFFRTEEQKPTMINNIRNMLLRAEMTEQEVRTFHGMITALRK